jgi:hypothetical protein
MDRCNLAWDRAQRSPRSGGGLVSPERTGQGTATEGGIRWQGIATQNGTARGTGSWRVLSCALNLSHRRLPHLHRRSSRRTGSASAAMSPLRRSLPAARATSSPWGEGSRGRFVARTGTPRSLCQPRWCPCKRGKPLAHSRSPARLPAACVCSSFLNARQ